LSYSLKNGSIYLGFNSIKGFGYEISKKIIDIRSLKENDTFISFEDAISSLYSNKISQKSIEILIRIGAFENFDVDENFLLVNFKEIVDKYGIIDTKTKLPLFDIVYDENYLKMPIIEKEQSQIKYLSMSFMKSNLEKYFDELKIVNKKLFTISSDEHKNFMFYLALVKISKIKKLITKFGKEMAFITVSDLSGTHDLSCFEPSLINKLENNYTYLIEVKNSDRGASLKSIIREIKTED
jgi:DNA polymerase III alpha subunit